MSGVAPRDVVGASGIAFVVGAVAPRLAYRLRWPSRLRGRGLVIYIAAQTGVIFVVRYCLAPQLRRAAADRTNVDEQLRLQLAREPTEEEVIKGALARRRR